MSKRVVDIERYGVQIKSLKSMIVTLAGMIGDEVYIRPVLEIESSEPVLKALDAVLEGAAAKLSKGK